MIQIYTNYCFSYHFTLTFRQTLQTSARSLNPLHARIQVSTILPWFGWAIREVSGAVSRIGIVCNVCTTWKSSTDISFSSAIDRLLDYHNKWKIWIFCPKQLVNCTMKSKYMVIMIGYKWKFGRERQWFKKKSVKIHIWDLRAWKSV